MRSIWLNRRKFITMLGGAAAAWPLPAQSRLPTCTWRRRSSSDAIANTLTMRHITIGANNAFTLAPLDFSRTPAGIDIIKVLDTRILPVINTGIAHREPGVGQIGAGVTRAPMACFAAALLELGEMLAH